MKRIYTVGIVLALIFTIHQAYGHGLGGDMAPPINFGGQNVTIETRIFPENLALFNIEEGTKPTIQVMFFDFNSGGNINEVTMFIRVEKDGKTLLGDWFYDPNGIVRLQINPVKREGFYIYGEVEPQLGGYFNRNGPVMIDAPIFLEGGLYKISATVKSALTTKQLLDTPISFDTWVSVADDNHFNVKIAEKEYPLTIRTYYDKITKLELEENTIKFDMPFNWDEEYVKLVPMVHEEIIIPKDTHIAATGQFVGYVNDVKLDSKLVITDPYTFPDKLIVHFVLDTEALQNIRQQIATDDQKTMRFKLVAVESINEESLESITLTTDNGKAKVIVQWPKQGIFPQQESDIRIAFFNPSNAIMRDIRYNVKFLDINNNIILDQNRYAPEGIDIIRHTFNEEGIVTIQVNIQSTGSMQKPDTSIAGSVETNITVVPEFPIAILVIGIAMIIVTVMIRKWNMPYTLKT